MKIQRVMVNKVCALAARLERGWFWRNEYTSRDARITGLAKDARCLSADQVRELNAFWKRYDKNYDVRNHAFFKEKRGDYSVNYVPNGFHYMVVDRFYNDWDAAMYLDNKCLYYKLFNVRLPECICYRNNGYWYNGLHEAVHEDEAIRLIMDEPEAFCKIARDSYCGKGIAYLAPESIKDRGKVLATLNEMKGQDIVVQKALKQSPVTASFAPASVNSMRVFSLLRKDGTSKVYSIILRMGMGKAKVDNAHSGGICCGVGLDGQLCHKAYAVNGDSFDEHPVSHIKFADVKLPNMEAVLAMAAQAHHCIPMFRLVGWDIALDENNQPVLIEANMAHSGVEVLQLCNGPLFGDDLQDILDEVMPNHP